MSLKRILFTTKFRNLAKEALLCLREFKKAGLEEIIMLHVVPIEEVGYVPYGGFSKEEFEKRKNEAVARFSEWAEELEKSGIRAKWHVELGKPVPKIFEVAGAEDVDMIVAGRSKEDIVEKFVGSDTEELLQYSSWPVMLMKYLKCMKESWDFGKKVMLATDWSEPAQKALGFLMKIKGMTQEVHVVHVVEKDEPEEIEKNYVLVEEVAEKFRSEGIKAEGHVLKGDPVKKILEFAEFEKVTMIVMGTSGRSILKALLLGSVSRDVAEHAEIPVVLVSKKAKV